MLLRPGQKIELAIAVEDKRVLKIKYTKLALMLSQKELLISDLNKRLEIVEVNTFKVFSDFKNKIFSVE